MNLLLLEPADVSPQGLARVRGIEARHLINVLRVVLEQTVRIGLIDGQVGAGRVLAIEGDSVTLQCTFDGEVPARPVVDLLLALPRPKVLQRLWAQVAALGVGRIMLTNAERVERHYFDTHVLSPPVIRSYLREGLQQARDTRVPQVSVHRQFRVLIEDHLDQMVPSACRLVADPSASVPVRSAVPATEGRVVVAVGPEGGWNDFELALMERHGFTRVTLGGRTLRSDTACVALLSVVHDAMSGHDGQLRAPKVHENSAIPRFQD